jgi:hypothetical protein
MNSRLGYEPSAIRSFRMKPSIIAMLELTAKRSRNTQSTIVSEAIVHFFKRDVLKPGFSGLTINQRAITLFLDKMANNDEIAGLGRILANMDLPLIFDLLDLEPGADSLLKFLEEIPSGTWNWFKFETGGHNSHLVLYHGLGSNWSHFLSGYVLEAFRIVHLNASTVVSENRVRIELSDVFRGRVSLRLQVRQPL